MAKSLWILRKVHQQQQRLLMVSPWSDSTSKDTTSMMPTGTFCHDSSSSSSQLPTPFPVGEDFGGPPINVSLGSAIGSAMANASTTKTFFVGFAPLSTFSVAFNRIMPRFGADFLVVSDFQTVQFSIFTFYELGHYWHRDCWPLRSNFSSSLERDHGCGC